MLILSLKCKIMTIGIDIRPLMEQYYSGVSEYTFRLLSAIFAQDKKNHFRLFYNSYHDVSARMPKFNFPNVTVVKFFYPNKILNYLFFKIFCWPKLDKKLGVDIFFMPNFNFIACRRQCPRVITVHDLSFLRYPHYFSHRHNFWQKSINIKKTLRQASRIIAVSNSTNKDIQELCRISPKKIVTIYPGISAKYRPIDLNEPYATEVKKKYQLPKKFILFLGTIEPRKNLEGIIEAYEQFRESQHAGLVHWEGQAEIRDETISLVIAGRPGWGYVSVYECARQSKYSRDIIFTDYIDDEDKIYLYNLAQFFIYPSFYEGFGFPPLEAAACGTPAIVSNVSSLPEIMSNAAILVDPFNIYEMAQAMAHLAYDKNLRAELSQAGLERAKQFNWEKCAREMIEVFETLKH